jgi:hypothetical protein
MCERRQYRHAWFTFRLFAFFFLVGSPSVLVSVLVPTLAGPSLSRVGYDDDAEADVEAEELFRSGRERLSWYACESMGKLELNMQKQEAHRV